MRLVGFWHGKPVYIDDRGLRKIAGHGVSVDDVAWVLERPDAEYVNTKTGRWILVRLRNSDGYILVLDDKGSSARVVTCWYARRAGDLAEKRARRGRWRKD